MKDNTGILEGEYFKETGKEAWEEFTQDCDEYSFEFVNWLCDKIILIRDNKK